MSWYTPESWQRMREIADDRDEWPDTFGAFVKKTERLILQFEREGIVVEKQVIDVDDCVRRCRRNGYRIDNAGRAAYGVALRCCPPGGPVADMKR